MRRLFLFRSFLILACTLCALPTFAIADDLDFELQTLDQTSATVKVTFNHGFGCIGPCRQETVNIWVTPCPPGQTCINDDPVFHMVAPSVPKDVLFTLQPGQTYTFRAYYLDQGSSGGQCAWNCESWTATPEVQYHVPDAPGWEIETVSTDVDTVWVDARFYDTPSNLCRAGAVCVREDTRYSISPCPLEIAGSNPNYDCTHETLTYRLYNRAAPVRVALKAGITYTFAGHMQVSGACPVFYGGCEEICCNVGVAPGTFEYKASTVATRPITWGAVKAMYRSP